MYLYRVFHLLLGWVSLIGILSVPLQPIYALAYGNLAKAAGKPGKMVEPQVKDLKIKVNLTKIHEQMGLGHPLDLGQKMNSKWSKLCSTLMI